uniref:Multi-CRP-I 1 n=1 Tax=Mytilus galloprovincialis TaxID=29158 RepID=A0A0A7ACX1_MYTGA|nr:multi-CRP-I 1 [Mytilus galloprovincialis]
MKVTVCLVACLLLVFIGVNMATDEMVEDNELTHNLVKRAAPCGSNGDNCQYKKCCNNFNCVKGRCKPKSCKRSCRNSRQCCNNWGCIYGSCQQCRGRTCKGNNDCCNGYKCAYKRCQKK